MKTASQFAHLLIFILCFPLSSAIGQDVGRESALVNEFATATHEGESQPRIIRWVTKPLVNLYLTSGISSAEAQIAEAAVREVSAQCECIAGVSVMKFAGNSLTTYRDRLDLVLDKNGFANTLIEFEGLVGWAYPSTAQLNQALPQELPGSGLNFRYSRKGSEIVRSLATLSTNGKHASVRTLVFQALILSLSPTLSQDASKVRWFMERRNGSDGSEHVISPAGLEYLRLLYSDQIAPGMTTEQVGQLNWK
jgi:hypothetical protein